MSLLVRPHSQALLDPRPPVRTRKPRARWHFHPLLILALITAAGGLLRFYRMDFPTLWGDEAATFRRVSSTYLDLLGSLREDGFAPLHYQLYWFIGQLTPLSPHMMRLVPALAGTLMIPAMYFLARQVVSVRAALVTAAFTAVSSFLIAYSRDAKMYMHFWLCATLHAGCFFWWLRTHRSYAFLSWLAAGVAMVGLHTVGFVLVALEPLYFLTARSVHWRRAIAFVIGLAVLGIGPLVHYNYYSKFFDRVETSWGRTGISWVENRNAGRTGTELLFDSGAGYLFGWLFLQEKGAEAPIPPRLMTAATIIMSVLLAGMIAGLFPWRRPADPAGELSRFASALEPPWRGMLWIGAWLIIPLYGFYCASVPGFVSPLAWVVPASVNLDQPAPDILRETFPAWRTFIESHPLPFIAAGGSLVFFPILARFLPRTVPAALGIGLLAVLIIAMLRSSLAVETRPGELNPAPMNAWPAALGLPYVLWAFAIAVPPIVLMHSGTSIRSRITNILKCLAVVVTLFVICLAIHAGFDDRLPGSVWMPRYAGIVWPALAIATCVLLLRLPTAVFRWGFVAILLGVNLTNSIAKVTAWSEPPLDAVVRDIVDANAPDSKLITLVEPPRGGSGSPGTGSLTSPHGRYYLFTVTSTPTNPRDFLRTNIFSEFSIRTYANPNAVRSALGKSPNATKIVLWRRQDLEAPEPPVDEIQAILGEQWKLTRADPHPVRFFWNWARFYTLWRHEFVKQE